MDRKILNATILNGAIELLPENLSTLAIIPLQMRLVYQHVMADGRQLQAQYLPQMQEMARGLNTARIVQMVRGD